MAYHMIVSINFMHRVFNFYKFLMSWHFQLLKSLINSWKIFCKLSFQRMSLVFEIGVKFDSFAWIHGVILLFLLTCNGCFNIRNLLFQEWNLFFQLINLPEGKIGLICWGIDAGLSIDDKIPWLISYKIVFFSAFLLADSIELKGGIPRITFLIFFDA